MDDAVQQTLKSLLGQHGLELLASRPRLEALLRDHCGDRRREIAVVVAAVREGVVEELRRSRGAEMDTLTHRRLAQRLDENAGIAEEYALWAVRVWAEALGIRMAVLPAPTQRASEAPAESVISPVPSTIAARSRASATVSPHGEERTNSADGAAMVYIPPGEFLMGSDTNFKLEKPQRCVHLDAYWIYKYPVTVGQYKAFCQATNRQIPPTPRWGWKNDHPMVNVTWNDASAYAQWAGVSLPTEAQWEKAARGTDGRQYPWGNEWDGSRCANSVGKNKLASTMPVGSYPKGMSPYGVHDMAGNVREWCADWYDADYYGNGPERNPGGPATGRVRVLRGGAWDNIYPEYYRAANRFRYYPVLRNYYRGFRCAQGP